MSTESLSQFVRENRSAVPLQDCSVILIKEIQSILRVEVDGIAGRMTQQAFEEFKQGEHLQFPALLGVSTAKELLERRGKEERSADDTESGEGRLNRFAGSRTGALMTFPNGNMVYENEYIVAGIPLTWGEVTKGCVRVPTSNEYAENAIHLARVWGEVREKFDSPIRITSGYRPPSVNSAVGGVRNSQHLYFRALDIQPLNGDFRKLWEVLQDSKFTGLGDAVFARRNKGFFHADIRPGGRVIFPY